MKKLNAVASSTIMIAMSIGHASSAYSRACVQPRLSPIKPTASARFHAQATTMPSVSE